MRGLKPPLRSAAGLNLSAALQAQAQTQTQGSAIWLPLGPVAVESQSFGLVTGRVSALALDPSDASGNTLYVGTTGGGVWRSQNADTSDTANIGFIPLTDNMPALNGVAEASISIGALAVQPGGTGVILAGTGDPNDALDSYYGAGILRSADGGNSWSLIAATADRRYSFRGEGFAGFAWSTANPQLVVAAVSQAYEGTLVNSVDPGASYEGLYYSSDGGASWSLATITDGAGSDVQGPNDAFDQPDGNAATSVVWNPVRQLFVAAVRFHGYYQSADGITWTRMASQPGASLTAELCPSNAGATGSNGCPIFRGTLAVNPQTGDTFAWTVDEVNQDQGIWQDECAVSAGACASATIWTAQQTQQWDTTALETDTALGTKTIENGDYNLALAAVPAGIGQEYGTILLAGANDLWKTDCPYSEGCAWRNTTNSTVGFCAQVGEYQHALAWNAANPQEILVGNDSGLWRSTDAIAETGEVCSSSDASHFQNLNGSLGSLAEVESIPQVGATPYTMMAGLGANGTAGVKSTTGPTAQWPEILGGEGGPVQIDPVNNDNWYVNNQAGVSIYLCSQESPCTPQAFGSAPVIGDADVGGDGLTMTEPAPFLVDAIDPSQLLVGTCRVWRGGTSGASWTAAANAISPILDGADNPYCNGDAMIRSMAAMALPSGKEVIYVGMDGSADGSGTLPGHVLSAVFDPTSGAVPAWTDLTLNPVSNDTNAMNLYGLDISSIFIDPHDATGKTVYVTVAGIQSLPEKVRGALRLDRRRRALDGLDGQPARDSSQQRGGGPAGRQHGLSRHRCRSLFDAADWQLRQRLSRLLVGLWKRSALGSGGCAQRRSRERHGARSGGRHLWPRHLDSSFAGSGGRRHGAGYRHSLDGFAHLPRYGRRAALGRAGGDADQQRRRAAQFDCHLGERAVPADECLHRQPGAGFQLRNQRGLRSHAGGQPDGHAHRQRFAAYADGGLERDGHRRGGDRRKPGQPQLYRAASGRGQRAADAHREQYRRLADGRCGLPDYRSLRRELFDRLDYLWRHAGQRRQLHDASDLYPGRGGRSHGLAGGFVVNLRRCAGDRAANRNRADSVRLQREPGGACLSHRGPGREQRAADSDRHQQRRRGGRLTDSHGRASLQPGAKHLRRKPCRRGKLLDGSCFFALGVRGVHRRADGCIWIADAGQRAVERDRRNARRG